jgi:molecular chaperone DnaK
MSRGHAVGIDLGTTNSVVAHGNVASASVIAGRKRPLPSVVAFTDDGAHVGQAAVGHGLTAPEATVRGVKRDLGTDRVIEVPDGRTYSPEQIASLVLTALKRRAEAALDAPVSNAVITVPATAGQREREATRRAAEIAGLTVDRLLSEPFAACLAYGVGTVDSPSETVLVYDLGGGTFDVSLVELGDGTFDVVATDGDTDLGGYTWDERIVAWLAAEAGHDLPDDPVTRAKLRRAATEVRHDLTEHETTTVSLPFLGDGVAVELTREGLDERTADLAARTTDICASVVDEVGWNPWTIDEVLLVGGMTRTPQVREAVYEYTGQAPVPDVNPDEAVATGAAIEASLREGVTEAQPLRGRTDGGDRDGPVAVDALARDLGIETAVGGEPGYLSPVIERNTPIPASGSRYFRTSRDGQRRVEVCVYEGTDGRIEDADLLGKCSLGGLPDASAGEALVEVTFTVDEDGVLDVHAGAVASGRDTSLTVESAFDRTVAAIRTARAELPSIHPAE